MTVDFRNSMRCFSKFQYRSYQEDDCRMFQKFAGFSRWEGASKDHQRPKRWVKEHKELLRSLGLFRCKLSFGLQLWRARNSPVRAHSCTLLSRAPLVRAYGL